MSLSLVNYRVWWASINCWKSAKPNKISFVRIIIVTSCKSVFRFDRITYLVNHPFAWNRESNAWSKIWRSAMKIFFDFYVYTPYATKSMPAMNSTLSNLTSKSVDVSPIDTTKWFEENTADASIVFWLVLPSDPRVRWTQIPANGVVQRSIADGSHSTIVSRTASMFPRVSSTTDFPLLTISFSARELIMFMLNISR